MSTQLGANSISRKFRPKTKHQRCLTICLTYRQEYKIHQLNPRFLANGILLYSVCKSKKMSHFNFQIIMILKVLLEFNLLMTEFDAPFEVLKFQTLNFNFKNFLGRVVFLESWLIIFRFEFRF